MRYVKTCCYYNWFDVVFVWLTLLLLWSLLIFSKQPILILSIATIMVALNYYMLFKINPTRWLLSVFIFPFRLIIAAAIIIFPLLGILFSILSCGASSEFNEKVRQSKDMRYKKSNREKHRDSAIEALPLLIVAGLIAAFCWKFVSSFSSSLFRSNNREQIPMRDQATDIPVETYNKEKDETRIATIALREPAVEVCTTNVDTGTSQMFNNTDMRIDDHQPLTKGFSFKKCLPETILLGCALLSVIMSLCTDKDDWIVVTFLAIICHILWRGCIIMKISILRKTGLKSLLVAFVVIPFVDSIFLVLICGIIESFLKK